MCLSHKPIVFGPVCGKIMASVQSLSDKDSDSDDTDEEMPMLMAVSWVASVVSGNPDTRGPSTWSDLTALLNKTIEDFFICAQAKPHLADLLNRYLRQKHGVCVKKLTVDNNGICSVEFRQTYPHAPRRCRWDGQFYSLSEILEWTFGEKHATLQWTLDFWERDFER